MNDLTATIWLAAARAAHFAACMLLANALLFDRLIVAGAFGREPLAAVKVWGRLKRWMLLAAWPLAALSGVVWFGLVAIAMSDLPPAEALQGAVLKTVWSQTHFGAVWEWRALLLALSGAGVIALCLAGARERISAALTWITLIPAAALLATLAWSGHGQDGQQPHWRLLADVLHLLASAVWPTGLLAMGVLLWSLRATGGIHAPATARLVRRFSLWSLASVATLAITGLINSCYMLMTPSDLIHSTYGRWLSVKILLFLLMVSLGAVNLLVFKPRIVGIAGSASQRERSAGLMRATVMGELFMGILIVVVVALLGTLMPPMM